MTALCEAKLEVFADPGVLAYAVTDWLLAIVAAKAGVVAVALSGGATPRGLYECVGGPLYRDAFPWSRIHWFWGDERFVARDDTRSNYHMAWAAMLHRSPVPAGNVHAIPTDGTNAIMSAIAYERELKDFYGSEQLNPARPLFDVVLLGLGADGHTASLFPGSVVLKERNRWVVPVESENSDMRVTLTYPALNSAHCAAFIVVGQDKRLVLKRLRHGDSELPASHIRPSGALYIFADAAAAQGPSS